MYPGNPATRVKVDELIGTTAVGGLPEQTQPGLMVSNANPGKQALDSPVSGVARTRGISARSVQHVGTYSVFAEVGRLKGRVWNNHLHSECVNLLEVRGPA